MFSNTKIQELLKNAYQELKYAYKLLNDFYYTGEIYYLKNCAEKLGMLLYKQQMH